MLLASGQQVAGPENIVKDSACDSTGKKTLGVFSCGPHYGKSSRVGVDEIAESTLGQSLNESGKKRLAGKLEIAAERLETIR